MFFRRAILSDMSSVCKSRRTGVEVPSLKVQKLWDLLCSGAVGVAPTVRSFECDQCRGLTPTAGTAHRQSRVVARLCYCYFPFFLLCVWRPVSPSPFQPATTYGAHCQFECKKKKPKWLLSLKSAIFSLGMAVIAQWHGPYDTTTTTNCEKGNTVQSNDKH